MQCMSNDCRVSHLEDTKYHCFSVAGAPIDTVECQSSEHVGQPNGLPKLRCVSRAGMQHAAGSMTQACQPDFSKNLETQHASQEVYNN